MKITVCYKNENELTFGAYWFSVMENSLYISEKHNPINCLESPVKIPLENIKYFLARRNKKMIIIKIILGILLVPFIISYTLKQK